MRTIGLSCCRAPARLITGAGIICSVAIQTWGCSRDLCETAETRSAAITLTEGEAIKRAQQTMGELGPAMRASASIMTLGDQTVPGLSEELQGQETWQIVLDGVTIREPSAGRINPHIRTITVLLSPDTGHVMKTTTKWPEELPPIMPAPSVQSEAEQMRGAAGQHISGLPPEPPRLTFSEALALAHGDPASAKEIVATYVLFSSELVGIVDRRVWIVLLRGLPPVHLPRPQGPPEGEPGRGFQPAV